jgi:putative peptide zinc metalloprotease protein
MLAQAVWQLNPNVRSFPFDDSSGDKWLLELDDAHGGTHRMVVSSRVFDVLHRLKEPQCINEVLEQLKNEGWSAEGIAHLRRMLLEDCVHRRLLIGSDDETLPAKEQPGKPAYMTAMVRLIPPSVVNLLARPLSSLYSRWGLIIGAVFAVTGQAMLLLSLLERREYSSPASRDILATLALGAGVLLLHELGHAAAAWRGGARKVGIGVGWYVVSPVAYAELSETWRFPARWRVLVDVAGVFMQSLAVFLLILAYRVFGNAVLLAAGVGASISILWNLNPLLRLDGYWLLSDLLRSRNLRADAMAALSLEWNQRVPAAWRIAAPRALPLGRRTITALAAYALSCTGFFALVIVLAMIRFTEGLAKALPASLRRAATTDWSRLDWADAVVLAGAVVWKAVILFFLGRFLLRLLAALFRILGLPLPLLRRWGSRG